METLNCISARACVRKYTSKAIPKDMIEKLIDAGRRAPTARAIEPWEFIVVTDKETLSSLSKIAEYGRFIKEAQKKVTIKKDRGINDDISESKKKIIREAIEKEIGFARANRLIPINHTKMNLDGGQMDGDIQRYLKAL